MNNWDCPPRHSSAAVGKRVNTFRFYTGHYARSGSQAGLYGWGGTASHFRGISVRELLWLAAGRLRHANASKLNLQELQASFAEAPLWVCQGWEGARTCFVNSHDLVWVRADVPSRVMMLMIITMADWWWRGDNCCVDDSDDECFTMMLMMITIVLLFLPPSVSRWNTLGKGCLRLPLLLVTCIVYIRIPIV